MTQSIPHIRLHVNGDFDEKLLVVRDGLQICLFLPQAHETLKPHVQRALDIYLHAIGRESLSFYVDPDGQWQSLDAAGWDFIQQELQEEFGSRIHMVGSSAPGESTTRHRFRFQYVGRLEDSYWPGSVSALLMTFPTKFLEAQGPERFRALALEIVGSLPFSSGHAGLSFNGVPQASVVRDEMKALSFRYPAMDVISLEDVARELGSRVRAPAWMNFLGPPVLSGLGGTEALRSKLHSLATTVQALGPDRAVVTLGPYPEAGDTEQGQTLPAYRELARVLEPWLYQSSGVEDSDLFYCTRRWQRRFLD
ncbi:DUF3396 domain-containing protein [Corallococcus macrosporus]|uniref:DUF3396 domain-containing protein n=1 Tax=Corallococcus macrosporus TaxID=35 RepID=A0ABS3DP76_9BACT|nr:DUF3396 domain-containing protein [Corallococcus macrosporus]MBN8233140.1 DUF3396 domain-containing protein [Corallococcus macrosporus]